jgi:DNA-binding transcriptional regulator YhcF (GntR family)
VHFNTVADAYRTLAKEGWLDVSQGRAVRVRERAIPPASSETRQMFLRRLRQLVAEARASGVPTTSLARDLAAIAETLK